MVSDQNRLYECSPLTKNLPVFTAALVISARLLWSQHESIQLDWTAIYHAKTLIKKAEVVFQHLDSENGLVLSCWKYIHELSAMCEYRGKSPSPPSPTLYLR
jgi:hypothetical protein